MTLDPQTANPRALAEALKRECERMIDADSDNCPTVDCGGDCVLSDAPRFAAALLGVVEECEKEDVTLMQHATRGTVLRAAALSAVRAGMTLTVEGEG